MLKKLGLAAVVLAIAATPAFAKGFDFKSGSIKVTSGGAQFVTSVNVANTGLNGVGGSQQPKGRESREVKAGSVSTGAALVISDTEAQMNTTSVGCGCSKDVTVSNGGMQNVLSLNVANSGLNGVSGPGSVKTGAAGIDSVVLASLNTTVVGGVTE